MINKLTFFFIFVLLILPISLITGPAIPDISITFSAIFFSFLIFYNKDYKYLVKNKILLISLIFWLYLILISFFAENKYLSFRDAIIFIRILLIPILVYYLINQKTKIIEIILIIILITVLFVTFDTLYQFTNYKSDLGFGKDLLGFSPNWYGRLTGPFGKELIPGAYLSKFAFFGLVIFFYKFDYRSYYSFSSIVYLTLVGLAIFASGERMALATYLMGLVFLLLFFNKKRLIFLFSLVLIILSCFLLKKIHPFYNDFTIIESTPFHLGLKVEKSFPCQNNNDLNCKKIINLQPEFSQVIKNFDKSAYGEIYYLALRMFYDHKFLGIGLNNFTYLCKNDERYKDVMKNYNCTSHPHNIYLQWLIEIGVIGLFIFLFYLLYLFFYIYKKNTEYALISISTLLVLFWPIMSTGSLLKNWNGISTFFIIGVCLLITNLQKKTN